MTATFRNISVIYNPRAGRVRPRLLQRSIEILSAEGRRVTAIPTTGPGAAAALAGQCIESGADLIVVAGGDGTINEAANGMIGSEVPLAVLPGGTADVLAHELGLARDMPRAAQAIPDAVPQRVAVGLLEAAGRPPRHFLLMAGAGLDAEIVHNLNHKLKARTGKLAYWASGLSLLGGRLRELEVEIEGRRLRCGFALAARVRNYGGDLEFASHADLFTDDFAVVLFEGVAAPRYLKYLAAAFAGRLAEIEGVSFLRARQVEFHAPGGDVHVQVDGEYAGTLPASVRIVDRALTLLVPRAFVPRTDG